MGHWGVRSYDNDRAHEAIDAAMERVHGSAYDDLMDDRNPLSADQVHERLADPATLAAAVAALEEGLGAAGEGWDDEARLAFVGVVVRHAERGVPLPPALRDRAIAWLEGEAIEWEEATLRRLRRDRELEALRRAPGAPE